MNALKSSALVKKVKIKLVETNKMQLAELEKFLEKKENQKINEETFLEMAKPINFSFSLEKCSRLLSHHVCESLDSYTQQSQRYVKMGAGAFIVPAEIKKLGEGIEKEYTELNNELLELYNEMTQIKEGFAGRKATEKDYVYGIKIEDGRYALPISIMTNVFITMNFSKIINFYKIMKRAKFAESEELLSKLDEAIGEENIVKKINEFADNDCVDEKKIIEFEKMNFGRISEKENCVLINSFENPLLRSGLGALTSTNAGTPSTILEGWEKEHKKEEKARGVTERVLNYGHESIVEHARTTFGLMMSLTCYHQFERHRLPNNIRERFEEIPAKSEVLIPEAVKREKELLKKFEGIVKKTKKFREKLGEIGEKKAGAYLLLNCDLLKVISSTNTRIDREVMCERLCNNAQWEIRELYEKKLALLKKLAPVIYDKIGPGCTRGPCPEGALMCGKIIEVRKKYGVMQ
ncbi:Thymidylate synthase ThyX [uncultured archaeon]|nr:Thymidylate synthase ThyX [uncultured archaeon]